MKFSLAATAAAVVCASSEAALIYATNFDTYTNNANLSGQTAWIGTGGNWATTGSVNTGQTAFYVTSNPSGSGRSVRMTTEKFNSNGRTKGYLDLSNSGKWAAASTGASVASRSEARSVSPRPWIQRPRLVAESGASSTSSAHSASSTCRGRAAA